MWRRATNRSEAPCSAPGEITPQPAPASAGPASAPPSKRSAARRREVDRPREAAGDRRKTWPSTASESTCTASTALFWTLGVPHGPPQRCRSSRSSVTISPERTPVSLVQRHAGELERRAVVAGALGDDHAAGAHHAGGALGDRVQLRGRADARSASPSSAPAAGDVEHPEAEAWRTWWCSGIVARAGVARVGARVRVGVGDQVEVGGVVETSRRGTPSSGRSRRAR